VQQIKLEVFEQLPLRVRCSCHDQARRQDLVAGGPKTRRGGHILKMQYGMYAATGGQTLNGVAPISNGGLGTTGPPLATALTVTSRDQDDARLQRYF